MKEFVKKYINTLITLSLTSEEEWGEEEEEEEEEGFWGT